jgi:hypothetical protein
MFLYSKTTRPVDVDRHDVFKVLTDILNKASNTYLGVHNEVGEANELLVEIRRFIPNKLYLVLDEAQVPARSLGEYYRSAAEPSMHRPILREILSASD